MRRTHAGTAPAITPDGYPVSHYAAIDGAPSRATILRAIGRGLDAVLIGNTYHIQPDDFRAWMASRRSPVVSGVPSDVANWVHSVVAEAPSMPKASIDAVTAMFRDSIANRNELSAPA